MSFHIGHGNKAMEVVPDARSKIITESHPEWITV